MATQPQGHSLLPAEHVTTPQHNIQLPTTLPPPTNPNSHPDPHPTPSHLSLSTPNSNITNPIPPQPPASENVVSRDLLPATDLVKTSNTSTTPKRPLVITPHPPHSNQPNSYISDSPPKRPKSDAISHHPPTTQPVVDALTKTPFQNTIIHSTLPHQSPPDGNASAPFQSPYQEQHEHTPISPPTSNSIDKAANAINPHTVIGSAPSEPTRETTPPPNAENSVIRYVPDPPSSAPSITTDMRTSPPNSDTRHRLLVLNSSVDTSSSPETLLDALPKRRKRDSSATAEIQANGQLSSQEGDLHEPELKRLKSHENGSTAISFETQAVKDDQKDDQKPLATDAERVDPKQTKLPPKADRDASKNETHSDTSGAVRNEPDFMQMDADVLEPSESAKTEPAVSVSPPSRAGMSLPILRSSPITIERDGTETRATLSKADEVDGGDPQKMIDQGDVQGDAHENAPTVTRKKKSVSWASEEKLAVVEYIDNRMELVRSWDADSQITLPFAPATLQMFQQALKDQDTVKRKEGQSDGKGTESLLLRSMPKLSSFEEARKREHDMEQEQAHQAREELKERLNAMAPSTSWRSPGAIVLPAECRIEDPVQRFDLVGDDAYAETLPADPDAGSPPSPPYRPRSSYGPSGADSTNVPVIPLSDRLNHSGDTVFESSGATDSDSRDYRRSESRQEFMADTPSRGRPKSDRGIDYKANSESSKDFRYSGSHNGGDRSLPLNTGSDSRMTQNSHGQYDMVQNNYADINPAPGSSRVQAMQHLLSALQSSGLLKPGSGSGAVKNDNADYNRASVPMHARGASNGSYRESQHSDQREVRNRDRDGYKNENQEDDRARTDSGMQSQGMATPDGTIPPPPLLGPGMGAPFPPGMQQPGMMDMMPFAGAMGGPPMGMPPMGMPPGGIPPGGMPPPPIGIPPLGMLQMMGLPVPMMSMPPGLQMTDGGQGQSTPGGESYSSSGSGRTGPGRVVETISRPKPKPPKQRKRCKYFGTKQGCRDGSACMFAHN